MRGKNEIIIIIILRMSAAGTQFDKKVFMLYLNEKIVQGKNELTFIILYELLRAGAEQGTKKWWGRHL